MYTYTSDPIDFTPGYKATLNIPIRPAQADETLENLQFNIANDSHRKFRIRIELEEIPT